MQAMVYEKSCIQCGLCPSLCPEVFSLDVGESARAIDGPVPEQWQPAARKAADECPVGAITLK